MATFLYKIKDDSGRTLWGINEASDINAIKKQFLGTEYYFISAHYYNKAQLANISLNLDHLLIFTHRFSSLIESGIPILQALHILWKQSETKNVQIIVSHIHKKLEEGSTLFEAFNAFPKVFPEMYLSLISVAEVGAGLVDVLRKLSQYLQEQKKFLARIKRITMYPTIILTFAFLVLIGMFTFVVPTFQKVLLKLHVKLPLLTQILFNLSGLIRNGYFIGFLFGTLIVILLLYKYCRRIRNFGYMVDSWKLKAPILKTILYPLSVSRFARSLSLLVGGGVPLVTGINVAKQTAVNIRIENAIEEAKNQVMEGGSLYEAFKSTKTFPIIFVEMIGIGESSGKLQRMLEKIADHLDEEVDYALYKFLTFLEPLSIILVGAIVLLVLLGIYFPIFSLQNTLKTL